MWKGRSLALIGGIMLAMALAEGAANDWLPLLMVDGHGMDATLGSLVYAGFAAALPLGRFTASFFLRRFGRAVVMRVSAVAGALGLLLVIAWDNAVVAGVSVLLWGLGASLGIPLALSAAGESGSDEPARVSLVATIGYVTFLVGPPGWASWVSTSDYAPRCRWSSRSSPSPPSSPRRSSPGDLPWGWRPGAMVRSSTPLSGDLSLGERPVRGGVFGWTAVTRAVVMAHLPGLPPLLPGRA